jgi:hypothetical protein
MDPGRLLCSAKLLTCIIVYQQKRGRIELEENSKERCAGIDASLHT